MDKKTLEAEIERLTPIVEQLKCSSGLEERLCVLQQYVAGEGIVELSCAVIGEVEDEALAQVEQFYESIGGIVGYHLKALQLLVNKEEKRKLRYRKAEGLDIAEDTPEVDRCVEAGISALPYMGEMYPLGGLGSRLDLRGKKGEALPAAMLPFLGRSLLEGLIRDVEAREYLYFKTTGRELVTPIALMASNEQHNFPYIAALLEKSAWFGRGRENFMLFSQLSVPVIDEEGRWVTREGKLVLQPGGHGALWKSAQDEGIFDWFLERGRTKLLVRQINNPIGGVDHGLLAFVGRGYLEEKTFGFASCERLKGVQEGALALVEEAGRQYISNIEYTDFQKYDVEELPANTNILYVDLPKLLPVLKKEPLPGLMLNMKEGGMGRLESMMQNISDELTVPMGEELPTYLTYNKRHRTISSAKRKYEEGKGLHSTPEGAFQDYTRNGHELLQQCGFEVHPSTLFTYHPKLGPLFSLIAQKLRGGKIAGELSIETPDIDCEELHLWGSLLIQGGRCSLHNVQVRNRGVISGTYWKREIKRAESCLISLGEGAEFHAEHVTLQGEKRFIVPPFERWVVTAEGIFKEKVDEPTWEYIYRKEKTKLVVESTSHILS
ncbi:MAG: UTP--glucose-1-phosphate uridylyltransferase [Chlamydiales bacterium]